jgi:hypothetical protein
MKKGWLLLALLALVTISSCKKGDDKQVNTQHYTVNGVHDITMYSNGDVKDLPVEIASLSKVSGAVTLSITDLPQGINATLSAATGIPTFNTSIRFTSGSIAPGTYPIKINTTSPTLGDLVLLTNLIVKANCTENLFGSYHCTDTTGTDSYADTAAIVVGGLNKIRFNNFLDSGYPVEGNVDCSNNTIDIPQQLVPIDDLPGVTATVSGRGYISGTTIAFSLVISIPGYGINNQYIIMHKL